MSPRPWRDRVTDMLTAIREIEELTRGMDTSAPAADTKTLRAVTASFASIGKAARRVPDDVVERCPAVSWRQMRDMRNWVVHVYFSVDPDILYETVRPHLPPRARVPQRILDNPSS